MTTYVPLPTTPNAGVTPVVPVRTPPPQPIKDTTPPTLRVVDVGSLYPPASAVNKAAASVEVNGEMFAGVNSVVPVIYGERVRTGLLIIGVVTRPVFFDTLYITGLIGHGELNNVGTLLVDGVPYALGTWTSVTKYTGTTTQAVDSALQAAYTAHGVTYTDAMPGMAYVVIALTAATGTPALNQFPNFQIEVDGRKVLDYRDSVVRLTSNPALVLADFITNAEYGAGRDIDVASFIDAANFCDQLVDGETRCKVSIALKEKQKIDDWITHLAAYTQCVVYQRGGKYYLRPNTPRALSRSFTKADIVGQSLKISRASLRNLPTVSTVKYTDTTVSPFQTRTATVTMPEVTAGTTGSREVTVELPGILRYSQAAREAALRLNQLQYGVLSMTFDTFDEAMVIEPLDVVDFALAEVGIETPKLMRVKDIADRGFGRWALSLESYDALMFSYFPQPGPLPIDPGIINPVATLTFPGPIDGGEELYQTLDGGWHSRLRATWPAAEPLTSLAYYEVVLYQSTPWGVVDFSVDIRTTAINEFVSYGLMEDLWYRLAVRAVSVSGIATIAVWSEPIHILGKLAPPGQVPRFQCIEVAGIVYMNWDEAPDLDVVGYELRSGPVGQDWAAMTFLTRIDALSWITPPQTTLGLREFAIKAIDSVGNYSVLEQRTVVDITQPAAVQLITVPFKTYALVEMWRYKSAA